MLIYSETNRWSQQDQRFPKVIYIQEVVIGIHPKGAKRLVRSPNYRSPSGGQAVSCRSWLPEAPAVTILAVYRQGGSRILALSRAS
jgi:hypothetical protein